MRATMFAAGFVAAYLVGAVAAALCSWWFYGRIPR
jgi:hypothetical protein